jgi:DNA polymerase-4
MKHYAEISREIREILLSFTPLVEPLSLDEAFLDVAGCESLFGPAPKIAVQIKERVKGETGLTASVGVAPNKFLAKLASDHGKPNGLVVVAPDCVAEFLAPLPVGRIWGVGKKAEKRLHTLGIQTIGQLARLSEPDLVANFGELGEHFRQLANGSDNRLVVPDREAKSISTETTFSKDISDRQLLRDWLLDLTDQLAARLRYAGLKARTVELKIRSSDFTTRHRAQALPEASNATDLLWQTAKTILEQGLTREMLPVRLLGVGATRLTSEMATQRSLFDASERNRQRSLDQAVDAIREQFGSAAVRRGASVDRADRKQS